MRWIRINPLVVMVGMIVGVVIAAHGNGAVNTQLAISIVLLAGIAYELDAIRRRLNHKFPTEKEQN